MLIGHYAVALGAKKLAPRTSLGTLVAAAAFLDLLWPFFLLAGVEHVVIAPGNTAFTPLEFTAYPWSHSLMMAVVWGLAFGAIYFAVKGNRTGAIIVGALVVSHWFLDVLVHRPDLPLTPFGEARVGLGLWNSVAATLVIELGMFAAGVWIYISVTRTRDRVGLWGLIAFLALCLIVYAGAAFGPPPPNVPAIAYADLGQFLFIALAAWVDAHRASRQ